MKEIVYNTNKQKFILNIEVFTKTPQDISIIVKDWKKPNTIYAERSLNINKKGQFFIRLPQSPETAKIIIYNEKEKKSKLNYNYTFKIGEIRALPLKAKFHVKQIKNPLIYNFIIFAQKFAERSGILCPKNAIYMSDDGMFRIDYVPIIKDRLTNRELTTPSRISRNRGIIEVSKKYFDKYTIPMRMAILLHEFAHYYLNKEMSNEKEADANALLIYLGLGYSRIEAAKVFLKVFMNAATDQNTERYKLIENMLKTFENNDYCLDTSNNYYYNGEL